MELAKDLDAILMIIRQEQNEIIFDDVISGMIADAWHSVKEYHLCMGTKDAKGNSVNSIERAINKPDSLNSRGYMADRDTVLELIKNHDNLLHDEKYQISRYVPYRLLSAFMKEIRGNERGLERRINIDSKWRKFFIDNMVSVRGWIQMKKARYFQDRNPEVPGIIYKISPGSERQ